MLKIRPIALGALAVGVFDILDAFIFFGLRGATPIRILQSIAGGLLGREAARAGGIPTAALGLFLHFFIATGIVMTCVLVSRRVTSIAERPLVFGPLYGIAVYIVMNWVVVPLSAVGGSTPKPSLVMLNGVLIHMFGVGIPAALAARAAADRPVESQ